MHYMCDWKSHTMCSLWKFCLCHQCRHITVPYMCTCIYEVLQNKIFHVPLDSDTIDLQYMTCTTTQHSFWLIETVVDSPYLWFINISTPPNVIIQLSRQLCYQLHACQLNYLSYSSLLLSRYYSLMVTPMVFYLSSISIRSYGQLHIDCWYMHTQLVQYMYTLQ